MALSSLRADTFVAPAIPAVPPLPIPNNITPFWSPTVATLISSANEAVLVDTLLTSTQATALSDWISALVPDKKLTTIYITHGHGDHFFGLSTLLKRFPDATAVATRGTLAHMEAQISAPAKQFWDGWFPGNQIEYPDAPLMVTALDPDALTIDLEGHTLHAVPAGHSDTDDTSFLWVPDLRMAVTGDIVYNGAYSYLAESLTPALRQRWLDAIAKVGSFEPQTVVVGHKIPGAVDGVFALDATKEYIGLWGRLVGEAKDARDLFERVRRADPDKTLESAVILWWSCLQQFPENGTANV